MIIIGLLNSISESFGNRDDSTLGNAVCSCVIITICMKNFTLTYNTCMDTTEVMTHTMQLILPLLIPFLVSIGGVSSGSILNPVIAGAVTAFNTIFQDIVLPVVFLSSIFILINSLTEKSYLQQLAIFLRKAAIFCTGFVVTVFSGITAIQSIVTKTADGLLVNTARFSVSNFVPIVGKFASDSVDMVLSCAALIKNSIGLLGIIIIICILTGPVIKLLAIAIIYKITAIISEPITTKQISGTLGEMGSSVITMTVILGLSALMFLIFLTIIISIGGGTLWK
jgi:stage III sporulation protein AE